MATHRWADIKTKISTERRGKIQREVAMEVLEMDLQALRKELGKTQVEVAEAAEMTQSELSRFEQRDDHRISSLRKVVHALGGELEVIAVVGDKRVRLHSV